MIKNSNIIHIYPVFLFVIINTLTFDKYLYLCIRNKNIFDFGKINVSHTRK